VNLKSGQGYLSKKVNRGDVLFREMRWWGAWLIAVVGCGASAAEGRLQSAPAERDRIVREARAELVLPLCRGDTDGVKACGLLTDVRLEPRNVHAFVERDCGGTDDGACLDVFKQRLIRDFRIRYSLASEENVEAMCRSGVTDCASLPRLELQWLESHNERAIARAQRELEALDRSNEEDRATVAANERMWRQLAASIAASAAGANRALSEPRSCSSRYDCMPSYVCLVGESGVGTCARPN
jgi:hypothetical protein